jgi:glycerol-3-phosphate dehydrogenase
MERNLDGLTDFIFDVLVVGGGIHGALCAWDAVLRGLSVALIERGDFGCGTSQNSLRIIHGGLRYIQDGNPMRVRTMVRERTTWMKIAPHLVHPQTCLMPTFQKFTRSRLALGVALRLNDLLSFDRNSLSDPEKHLAGGRIISASDCVQMLPGYERRDVTGAAVWHDGQIYNSERLLLAFVLSAAREGAVAANYVEATELLNREGQVRGVKARDVLSGQLFDIQAKVVINCAGAWIERLNQTSAKRPLPLGHEPSIAMDLIVRQLWPDVAAGIPDQPGEGKRSQILFVVPWRDKSMIGTWHIPWRDSPDAFQMSTAIVQDFLNHINSANPGFKLTLEDVQHVHWGFLPAQKIAGASRKVKLVRDGKVIDHRKTDGLAGLVSVIGVKYTTARQVAEQAVSLAAAQVGKKLLPCRTHTARVMGGEIDHFQDFLASAQREKLNGLSLDLIRHLVNTYGSEYTSLCKGMQNQPSLCRKVDPGLPVILAEVVHAVKSEMAQKLIDVIQRRTELGTTKLPSLTVLQTCARAMANKLGWDAARQQEEIEAVIQAYPMWKLERNKA